MCLDLTDSMNFELASNLTTLFQDMDNRLEKMPFLLELLDILHDRLWVEL